MKARSIRRILVHIAILTILIGRCSQAAAPVVHLLAPDDKAIDRFDPLIAETALRLVSAELAAKYGIFAKYWSVDQLSSVPADAYPRIELEHQSLREMPYLRLTREGGKIECAFSEDGKEFWTYSELESAIPDKCQVGLFVSALPNGKAFKVGFTDVTLNGKAFNAPVTRDLGATERASAVSHEAGKWVIETFGGGTSPDPRGAGCYVLANVEGDFDLRARAPAVLDEWSGSCEGLICREAGDLEAEIAGLFVFRTIRKACVKRRDAKRFDGWDRLGLHRVRVRLLAGPDEQLAAAEMIVDCWDWDTLRRSIERLTASIEKNLESGLGLDLANPTRSVAPNEAQAARLAEAREAALNVTLRGIVESANRINQLLNEAPTCARAHRTAALCGTMPALYDIAGRYHEHARFLAIPFSHWLLAERLAPATGPKDALTSAWLMFACGYPARAHRVLEQLAPTDAETPEAAALEMFITRDYRRFTVEDVLNAAAIEQLAWMWATQQCGRDDLLQEVPQRLVLQNESGVFLPTTIGYAGVGPGHATSVMGILFSAIEDAEHLLTADEIALSRRKKSAERVAEVLNLARTDDPALLAESLRPSMENLRFPHDMTALVSAIEELRHGADGLPAGPVKDGNGMAWNCLPLPEISKLRSACFIDMLDTRARFMWSEWGVPEAARDFCLDVALGFPPDGFAGRYFKGMASCCVDKPEEAAKEIEGITSEPILRVPVVLIVMADGWPNRVLEGSPFSKGQYPDGRGAWDWSVVRQLEANRGNWFDALAAASNCLREDEFPVGTVRTLMFHYGDVSAGEALLERMPYNLNLLQFMASEETRLEREEQAISLYQKMIDLAPGDSSAYYCLAFIYARREETGKAIEVAKRAAAECEYSVGLSNLLGWLARWLAGEGKVEEALVWGERAAESYSALGLIGLAVAQEANGMLDEAYKTFKACAERYGGDSEELTLFVLRHSTEEQALTEVRKLLKVHSDVPGPVKWGFGRAVIRGGGTLELLERGMKEGILTVPDKEKEDSRIVCAMNSRDFAAVKQCYEDGAKAKPDMRSIAFRMIAYASARLSGDQEFARRVEKDNKTFFWEPEYGALLGYQLGRLTYDMALQVKSDWYHVVLADWIKATTAEVQGDIPAAIAAYRAAANAKNDWIFVGMARNALRRLEAAQEKAK